MVERGASHVTRKLKIELKDLRRRYKLYDFKLRTECLKFSTVHSFKGWEIRTLFFIISDENDSESDFEVKSENSFLTPELLYTGLTRARNNLFILNIGVEKYNNFFWINTLI